MAHQEAARAPRLRPSSSGHLTLSDSAIYFPVATIRDQAFCIRQWDWSETSQTVSLFSREHGVIRAVAKGSRREKGAFSGGLEVLTRGEMVVITRHQERATDAMATLTAWDLQELFPRARRSLAAFHVGMYMLDLVHHAVRDSDPHPGLFDDLLVCLRGMDSAETEQRAMLAFQWAVLVHAGFAPQLFRDARTGHDLNVHASYSFSPDLGGLVGGGAPDRAGDLGGQGSRPMPDGAVVWRVRGETVELLRRLSGPGQSSHPGRLLADPSVGPGVVSRANRLLAWYLRSILGVWAGAVHGAIPGIGEMEPQAQ